MAVNIFDKYGIKEVANVYFEALADDPASGVYAGDIVLYLDSLKTSTIETTAENTAAQGGWGNPKLIQWDYGKEINVTLTDALMSLESLRFMMGAAIKRPSANSKVVVRHTEEVVCETNGKVILPKDHLTQKEMHPKAVYGHPIRLINLTKGTRTQLKVENSGDAAKEISGNDPITFVNPKMLPDQDGYAQVTEEGDRIRIFWDEVIENETGDEQAVEVTISPSTFPGTYRVVGDTFMRSADTGKDEAFQFVINKAKVASSVTLTLEAEGDPTTFEMTLNVLRDNDEMMKLVRYTLTEGTTSGAGNDYGSIGNGSGGT